MSYLQTIPRFGIDYQLEDFMTALGHLFTTRTPVPRMWPALLNERSMFWTGSGRQALRLILRAMKLPPEAKVAVPLYCDFSIALAIKAENCTPVFVDVEESTLTMDPASLARVRGNLSAILVPHFFGHVADMDRILQVAGPIPVIEDAAHAPLSALAGRAVGTFGVACLYSFGSTKPFPAGGGGLAVANDPGLAEALAAEVKKLVKPALTNKCWNLMAHAAKALMLRRPYYGLIGRALRSQLAAHQLLEPALNEHAIHPHQAEIVLRQVARMEAVTDQQRHNSNRLLSLLSEVENVALPWERPEARYNRHIFPVLLATAEEKKTLASQMLTRHIDTSEIYWDIVGKARKFGYRGDCPVSESVAGRMMTLPNNATLSDHDIDYIANSFIAAVQECRLHHAIRIPAQDIQKAESVATKVTTPMGIR